MKGAIAWFARNAVAANLCMLVIIVAGLATIPRLTQELIPDIELDMVSVTTTYPGASPTEVEASITSRVEEQLQGLQGIKRIRSTSAEAASSVIVELLAGEDIRARLDDVRAAIDAIDTLPDQAEEPVVKQIELDKQVLNVTIAGATDELTLKRVAQQVRDEIASLPGITEATLRLARPYEIAIEVSEQDLRRFGLSFDDVVVAVQRSSLDLPGGSLKTEGGEILLRARGQAYRGEDFERIALVSRRDGTRLMLGDVAQVIDGFEESDVRARFDGNPALLVQVFRVGDQKAIGISDAVREYVNTAADHLPPGIQLTVWNDTSVVLSDRLGTMVRNARGGFVLVVLILACFLRLNLAMWVSLGIPVSFLGAVAVMPELGMTINYVSLLGFIVVLGIIVDDAIVVGESTHTFQEQTGDRLQGAILGAQAMVVPVVFGVLTTMAAFAPMLFLPGPMGLVSRVAPIVVISCLAFSLFEALFILPAHLAHGRKPLDSPPTTAISKQWRRFQQAVARGLAYTIDDLYRPAVEWALSWRYLTLAIAIGLLLVTAALPVGGWLKFIFQEPVEADFIVAELTMAQGTPAQVTGRAADHIEQSLFALRDDLDREAPPGSPSAFTHVMTMLGEQPFAGGPSGFSRRPAPSASNLAEIQVALAPPRSRSWTVPEIVRRWRERVGDIPGAVEIDFKYALTETGAPIEVELSGHDLERLRHGAGAVRSVLAAHPGVFDVTDSFRGGKQEFEYQILPAAESLGLSLADLARQLRQGFYGAEAQTVQRGRDEVKVMVRYPADERRSLDDVQRLRIRGPDGSEVPFSSVANVSLGTGYSVIRHVDRRRVVSVTADVDTSVTTPNEVVRMLRRGALAEALDPYPGVKATFEGEQAEQRDFLRAQLIGMAASLLVIYALLAIPLSSYVQPLIIMSAIPFGFVGAAWGHVLLGYPLTMYSVIGLVALAGIVVNASLVLVDSVNKLIAEGADIHFAIIESGRSRFRPILLTSITTFAGLMPMILEKSVQGRFMIPMAISIAFGVLSSTFITLFLVPCTYAILEDLRSLGSAPGRVPDAPAPAAPVIPISGESRTTGTAASGRMATPPLGGLPSLRDAQRLD